MRADTCWTAGLILNFIRDLSVAYELESRSTDLILGLRKEMIILVLFPFENNGHCFKEVYEDVHLIDQHQ